MEKFNLSNFASEQGIKYFLVNFTDLFGVQRAKMVPSEAIDQAQKMELVLLVLQLGLICRLPTVI